MYRSGKSNSDVGGLYRMSRDYDVSESKYKVISMENIHAWCKGHFVQPYGETLCVSTNYLVDQIDSQYVICPKNWRYRQRDDPILGTFVLAMTNKTKPKPAEITSKRVRHCFV